MNPQARKRLIISLIILVLGCFGLYLYFDNSQSIVPAKTAQLKTATYDVGTPYSGQITKQFVQVGDSVKADQKLFYIDSSELNLDLKKNNIDESSLGVPTTSDGQVIITATKPGVVKAINASQGSFVPSNTVMATISQMTDLQVQASVVLSPDQYAKIDKNSRLSVILPDGQVVDSTIANINIVNQDNQVIAQVTGDLSHVKANPLTTKDGTPVVARLRIQHSLWQRLTNAVTSWVRGII